MPVLLPINCYQKCSNSKMDFKYYKIPKRIWHNHKISFIILGYHDLSLTALDSRKDGKGIIYNTIVTVVIWLRWQEFKSVKWGSFYFSTFVITIKILTYHKANWIIPFFFKMKTYEIPMIKLEGLKSRRLIINNGRTF